MTQSKFDRRGIVAALALGAAVVSAGAQAQELTGTLKKVKDTNALTIGYRDSSVPFSYLDGDQKPVGYAMDICLKIAEAVKKELKLPGMEVKLNPVTSATRIPLIANGTIDLECCSTTNNADRQKQAAFTNTHFLTATRYVSKKDAKLHTIDDLKGKTVVSTSGTTNIKQINEANTAKSMGLTILPAKDHAEAFLIVETGRAVAFVMDPTASCCARTTRRSRRWRMPRRRLCTRAPRARRSTASGSRSRSRRATSTSSFR